MVAPTSRRGTHTCMWGAMVGGAHKSHVGRDGGVGWAGGVGSYGVAARGW